jgi:Protein of unknown function (DUF2587)
MAEELLAEIRQAPLDQASQARLGQMLEASIAELSSSLPPGLCDELRRLVPSAPGQALGQMELRLAQAQLTGWLEGVLWGIQAPLVAHQAAPIQLPAQRSEEPQRPGSPRGGNSDWSGDDR